MNQTSLLESSRIENRVSRASRRTKGGARGLAFFSLGVGLAELLAPSSVAKLIGLPNKPSTRLVLRLLGARELASGLGIVGLPRPAGWVWSRVAGDMMDLALLAKALSSPRSDRRRLAVAAATVAGAAVVDAVSAVRLSRDASIRTLVAPIRVRRSVTVNRPPEEVYRFWRDLENLPRFMAHLESVTVDNGHSTWKARGPAGLSIEWQAEIVLDRPYESIGWKSIEGSTSVPNRGVVRFSPAPGNRGTEVMVELLYEPPAGALGAAFAKLFGEEPNQQIAGDLRRLKQVLETGEVVHSDASIHRRMHPARPTNDGSVIAGARK